MQHDTSTKTMFGLRFTIAILLSMSAFYCADTYATDNSLTWLKQSIDPTRSHDISIHESWHARLMVLAWGVLIPLGVVAARFFKILPKQNWPNELDRREWWWAHLVLQCSGATLAIVGVILILILGSHEADSGSFVHRVFGWLTMSCLLTQVIGGLVRGTRGGPSYPAPDGSWRGDHYDMTFRRKIFEHLHKWIGYLALLSGCITITLGLWMVNAPWWMWLSIFLWWLVLIVLSGVLQRHGYAVDTYQAIWGPDPKHPGNQSKPIGLGVHRPDNTNH